LIVGIQDRRLGAERARVLRERSAAASRV